MVPADRVVPPTAEVLATASAAGLDRVGVAGVEPFTEARRAIEERRRAGLHGGMQFTYRNPARSTDPTVTWPWARSLVVGALGYWRATPEPSPAARPVARVARYARQDHYTRLRDALEVVAGHLRGAGWRAQVVADDNALVDRAAAVRAGLGWFGKNANVLLAGQGSWFVLGSVVTDAPLRPTGGDGDPAGSDGCGSCRRCLDGCPTGAIVAPGVVDARRCLAWLVQSEGSFPVELRRELGDRLYGCDDCQEVCPPSRRSDAATPDSSSPDDDEGQAWVSVLDLLDASDDELLRRFGRWYVPRRDPRYLRRNALVVLGNCGAADDPRVAATLARYRCGDDPLLAEHADWAARELGLAAPVGTDAGVGG